MPELPAYDRPPVVESVLGVQFKPIGGFTNSHLGAFWNELRDDWPNASDAPPLSAQYERFDQEGVGGRAEIGISTSVGPQRLMIKNHALDRMIQVQRTRFHYNWLATPERHQYPSYEEVRPGFDEMFDRFGAFVAADERLGAILPDQWEVTYVNHLFRGESWQDLADVARLLPMLVARTHEIQSATLERLGGVWSFELVPQLGRLHVELNHAWKGDADGRRELFVLKLTARGPIQEGSSPLDDGLNLGHQAIVETFTEVTSADAHEAWRRTR